MLFGIYLHGNIWDIHRRRVILKKLIALVLAFILCLPLVAPGTAYAATIKLNKSKLELYAGNSYTIKLSGVSGSIKWSSSKKTVATVSSKGKVVAIKEGKTTITAVYKEKKYKCDVTVNNNKTVNVVYTAYIFDDATIEEYAKQYKEDNPDCIEVKAYDDEHIVVTMYEVDRVKTIKDFNTNIDTFLTSIVTDDNYKDIFTDVKSDKLLQNIKIYANKDNYEDSYAGFTILLSFGLISEAVQAINLVDVNDRICNIDIYDNENGDILYTTSE
ncbi:MAG: hypothetical protein K0S01_2986 [Herbinix sp.]|jgi:uncharacterized cupredoxin-like copper-binding protein|nr:hypothetical protein [Herbinix sp.]